MRSEKFTKGEYLFKIGDKAEKLYYVAKGVVRLPEINCFMQPGQVIGEMGIFSPGKKRTASAMADVDVETFTLTSEEVRALISRQPALGINLMQLSIKRSLEQIQAETAARERINTELRIAREIQTSLLPRTFPAFPHRNEFDVYAVMEPAKEVGGDLYDFFFVSDQRLCALVGDVSGKGVPAALFMAVSKALLKSEAMRGYPVSEILARVNNLLCPDNPECMFVTVFCLILNTETGEAECCSAGHQPPLLCNSSGPAEYLDLPEGVVIGFQENCQYRSRTVRLNPGQMLLLYTDGVTEAENSREQPFSETRLKDCLSGLHDTGVRQVIDRVQAELALHTQGYPQSDDITMLVLKYNGRSKG
jgi:sigma-B regulation protein RsbU (phosphoserine phosphatase)